MNLWVERLLVVTWDFARSVQLSLINRPIKVCLYSRLSSSISSFWRGFCCFASAYELTKFKLQHRTFLVFDLSGSVHE